MSENINEKAYELRKLTADDIFPMVKIISKIGLKEFKSCLSSDSVKTAIAEMANGNEGANIETVGIGVALDFAGIVFEHLPECRDDIYNLLSSLSGMKKDRIAALSMATFMEMVVDVIRKEEFKDFFQAVSKFLK